MSTRTAKGNADDDNFEKKGIKKSVEEEKETPELVDGKRKTEIAVHQRLGGVPRGHFRTTVTLVGDEMCRVNVWAERESDMNLVKERYLYHTTFTRFIK